MKHLQGTFTESDVTKRHPPPAQQPAPQPADVASARISGTVAAGVPTAATQPVLLLAAGRPAARHELSEESG